MHGKTWLNYLAKYARARIEGPLERAFDAIGIQVILLPIRQQTHGRQLSAGRVPAEHDPPRTAVKARDVPDDPYQRTLRLLDDVFQGDFRCKRVID